MGEPWNCSSYTSPSLRPKHHDSSRRKSSTYTPLVLHKGFRANRGWANMRVAAMCTRQFGWLSCEMLHDEVTLSEFHHGKVTVARMGSLHLGAPTLGATTCCDALLAKAWNQPGTNKLARQCHCRTCCEIPTLNNWNYEAEERHGYAKTCLPLSVSFKTHRSETTLE